MSVSHRAPQPASAARHTPRLGVSPRLVSRAHLALIALLGVSAASCSELQARRHARTGNNHYREGDYAGAVREYE